VKDRWGPETKYLLADRSVRVYYDKRRHHFACRNVTRLDLASGHMAQVLTTRTSLSTTEVAQGMFSRWREEDRFRSNAATWPPRSRLVRRGARRPRPRGPQPRPV
jgi:hypothetical protein